MMPGVLVIVTLLLIWRKMIYRTFISKCKEELPDYFDPESLIMGRFFDGYATHHQYHDLRQRSSTTNHSDVHVPPFHQLQYDGLNSTVLSPYDIPMGGIGQGQGVGFGQVPFNHPHFYTHTNPQNQTHSPIQVPVINTTTVLPRPCTKLKGGRDRGGNLPSMDVGSSSNSSSSGSSSCSNSGSSGINGTGHIGTTTVIVPSAVTHRGTGTGTAGVVGMGMLGLSSRSRSSDAADNSNSVSSSDNTPRLREGSFRGLVQRVGSPRESKVLTPTKSSPTQHHRQHYPIQQQQQRQQYYPTRQSESIPYSPTRRNPHPHLSPSRHHKDNTDWDMDRDRDRDRERDAEEGLYIITEAATSNSHTIAPPKRFSPLLDSLSPDNFSPQLSTSADTVIKSDNNNNNDNNYNNNNNNININNNNNNYNNNINNNEYSDSDSGKSDDDSISQRSSIDDLDIESSVIVPTLNKLKFKKLVIITESEDMTNWKSAIGDTRVKNVSNVRPPLSPMGSRSFDFFDRNAGHSSVLTGGKYLHLLLTLPLFNCRFLKLQEHL